MEDWTLASSLVRRWARAPLDPQVNIPGLEALLEEAGSIRDPRLRGEVEQLFRISLASFQDPAPRPEPARGDDVLTAVNLISRMMWGAHDAGASPSDEGISALAAELDDLASASAELAALDLTGLCRSQAIGRLVRYGSDGVSPARLDLLRRLFALDPATVMPRAYLMALSPFAESVVTAGRADLWQEIVTDFRARVGDQVPGDILMTLASLALPVVSDDSRWYRAEQTWDQAELLLDDARRGVEPLPAPYTDPLSVDLGLAYLRNRDLDERPFLDVVTEVYDRLYARVQTVSRPDLLTQFALFLARLRVNPRHAATIARDWADRALLDQTASRDDQVEGLAERFDSALGITRAMELVLNLRGGDDDRVMAVVDAAAPDQLPSSLELIVGEGRSPGLAERLDAAGRANADPHLGTAQRLTAAAVLARSDPAAGTERFGELGGLGSGGSDEPEDLARFRFTVSQAVMPEWESPPEGIEPVDGVPLELYSDDPSKRLWAVESQFGGPAFMSALAPLDIFRENIPVLEELYSRGIADIDENVVEASVIFARRIIYGFQQHDLRDEALAWARRVAADLQHATTPRAVRARVLALHDIVREAERPEAEQAAELMRELLRDNDADYAIVERALLLHTTHDWEQDLEPKMRTSEELIPMLIGAIEHDEYEQQDWSSLIRDHAMWLFHRYADASNWTDAVRVAGIFLQWPGDTSLYELNGVESVILRLRGNLVGMDQVTANLARRLIDQAWDRIGELGQPSVALVEARGAVNAASDLIEQDPDAGSLAYWEALPRYRQAIDAYLADRGDERRLNLHASLTQHASSAFTHVWACDHESQAPTGTKWLRTARAIVAFLRAGTQNLEVDVDRDLGSMVRLAALEHVFRPLDDRALVDELYERLAPLADVERDGQHRVETFQLLAGVGGRLASLERVQEVGQALDAERRSGSKRRADPGPLLVALAELRAAYDESGNQGLADGLVEWSHWLLYQSMLDDAANPRQPYNASPRAAASYLALRVHELDPEGDAQVRELVEWATHAHGFMSSTDSENRRRVFDLLAPLVDPSRDDAKTFAKHHQKVQRGKLFGLF